MNLNKVILVGRLTSAPDARTLPSGQPVANFGLATNRIWNDKDGNRQEVTEFHNIVLFGKLADIANRYLVKGATCLIVGRLQTRSWQGKDGQKRYRTEVIGEELQLGPRPRGTPAETEIPSKKSGQKEEKEPEEDEGEVDVEDIPF